MSGTVPKPYEPRQPSNSVRQKAYVTLSPSADCVYYHAFSGCPRCRPGLGKSQNHDFVSLAFLVAIPLRWEISGLQLLGSGQKSDHAGEEAAGGATIEDAMIEAEGEVSFHGWHELAFGGVPTGDAAGGAHAQDQRLLR